MTTYFSFSAAIVSRQVARLLGVERIGPAVRHVAERAAARAQVAHDHEGGGAVAEAFADVRARRFLAHGVQLVLAQDLLDLVEARLGEPARTRIQSGFFSARDRHDLDRNARGLGLGLLLERSGRGGGAGHACSGGAELGARVDGHIVRTQASDTAWRSRREPGIAARIDAAEGRQVHRHVERDTVIAVPADLHADRGDLARPANGSAAFATSAPWPNGSASRRRPRARRAALAGDAVARERLQERLLEPAHEFLDVEAERGAGRSAGRRPPGRDRDR